MHPVCEMDCINLASQLSCNDTIIKQTIYASLLFQTITNAELVNYKSKILFKMLPLFYFSSTMTI